MVSKKEPEQKQGGMKRILAAIAIIATALFLLAAAAPASAPESSMQPASTTQNYTPTPVMNTNITWSTFQNGWNPLEYSNGTSNLSLNAQQSTIYPNYISVNPTEIQSNGTLTNDKLGSSTSTWENLTWSNTSSGTAATETIQNHHLVITDNTSSTSAVDADFYINLGVSCYPSNNLQYDYLTAIIGLSGAAMTGVAAQFNLWNSTGIGTTPITVYPGQDAYISENLNTIQKNENYISTFNTTGKGASSLIKISPDLTIPKSSTYEAYTLTLYALALTDYPLSLGSNASGATITQSGNTAQLSSLSPSFSWSSITGNGYSVSVSQPMQNTTEQQTSINDGSYTEQATYQGIFEMPTAPDLTYSTSNITIPLTVSGTQYEVANLNGISYLTSIQSKTNGTFSFGVVNPNSQNSLVLEVKYTTAQWDSSSSAPSFFSLAGIEYYWWVAILGVMGLIGLGSVAISHFGGEEETLRVPKGKFGR